jgi:WD40 repeat protein
MDYKQKYFKYKQKYLRLLKDQKGGEPFLIDISAKPAYLWLFNKNQRQLKLIFTRRQITFTMPLETITLNPKHRLDLLTKGSLSVVLVSRLVGLERSMSLVKKRILSRLHVLPPISPPTCVFTDRDAYDHDRSIAFHPTLPLLVTGTSNHLKTWNCTDPEDLRLENGQFTMTSSIREIKIHQNSTYPLLIIIDRYERVKLWNCTDMDNLIPIYVDGLTQNDDDISNVAFHPILPLLAVGSRNNIVKLWDCSNLKRISFLADLTGHTNRVNSFAFHPKLPYLATGSSDRLVKLWDCSTPQNPFIMDLPEQDNHVISVAFHSTLSILAVTYADNNIKLWDCVTDPRNPILIKRLDTDYIYNIVFHSKLPILAMMSMVSSTIKLWDFSNLQNPHITDLVGHNEEYHITSVAFHSTLPLLASLSMNGELKLWK